MKRTRVIDKNHEIRYLSTTIMDYFSKFTSVLLAAVILFTAPVAPASDSGVAVPVFSDSFDRQKYMAFKELSRQMEVIKKIKDEEKMDQMLREYIGAYEKTLMEAGSGVPDDLFFGQTLKFAETEKVSEFLRGNVTTGGMPLSYKSPENYWKTFKQPMDAVDAVVERLLIEHSVNIYDAATWQIALAITAEEGDNDLITAYTQRLSSGASGELWSIRAYDPVFRYGDSKKAMGHRNAYFFRIIADQYIQEEPLGMDNVPDFPNFPTPHHEDWKPITGEQAWAAMIGPLQSAYIKYQGRIPVDCDEVKLALSILPAVEWMQAPNGAIYHVPDGTYGKSPREISNENNYSMYAALRMLHQVLKKDRPREAARIKKIIVGQLNYFKKEAFDKERGIFDQGGFYLNGAFLPARLFAVDCQTWAITALGPRWIDQNFGHGASYRAWRITKRRAGYFDNKKTLRGTGFTAGHDVFSVEWTCGAILAATLMAEFYEKTNPRWAMDLRKDAVNMRQGVEKFKVSDKKSTAYLYANKRYFIPWGWWANPIPSLASSSWVVMIDKKFNPFILGGGDNFQDF